MAETRYALIRFQETGDGKARAGLLVGDRVRRWTGTSTP